MFKALTLDLALETFVGVDLSREEQRQVNKAFIAAVRAGTSVIRRPVPGTTWSKGLKARAFLEEFFRAHLPAKRRDGATTCSRSCAGRRARTAHEFSDDDIVNHMIFLLMAAHDTTTITLSSMAYHLAKHPEWQERAREESLAAGDVDYDGVLGLDVLDRVMKESMRLCAPVPSLPRVAVRDTGSAGLPRPRGRVRHRVAVHEPLPARALAGPHALRPRPVRARPSRGPLAPAGLRAVRRGVHKCIGMHFAGMQVRAIFHELLRSYRWSVPDDYVWPLDLTALPYPRDGVPVQLERPVSTSTTTSILDAAPGLRAVRRPPSQRRGRGPDSRGQSQHALPRLPNKEALLEAVLVRQFDDFLTELDRVAADLRRARRSSSASPAAWR